MVAPRDQEQNTRADPNTLMQKTLELLEFGRIRELVESYTSLPISGEMALALLPSYDRDTITYRQQETSQARLLIEQMGQVDLYMERDIRSIFDRVAKGGYLTGDEFLLIVQCIDILKRAKSWPGRRKSVASIIYSWARNIPDFQGLYDTLKKAILPSGELTDNASPYLSRLRIANRENFRRANENLQRILSFEVDNDIIQERIVTVRADRLVIPIKAEFRSRISGIVHDISDSGSTIFLEPIDNVPLCNLWRESQSAEREEVANILRRLSGHVSKRVGDLMYGFSIVGRLDLVVAKARFAADYQSVGVGIDDKNIRLIDMRHPLLVDTPVPISVIIESPQSGLVITGPNTGGKTVALKALGLAILMHQAGLQVPANASTVLPIFDGIFADIGDQQSIKDSVSTFSSHIMAIIEILAVATSKSLVLLDELGTSTDPEEGSALARAILWVFAERHIRMVVTTHFRDVAYYADKHPALSNASVELDPRTLIPTYQLVHGLPGRSYAMEVARKLGLPNEVLDVAKEHQNPLHLETGELLNVLQQERLTTRERLLGAEEISKQAEDLRVSLENKLEEIEKDQENLLEATRLQLLTYTQETLDKLKLAESAIGWQIRQGKDGTLHPSRVINEHRESVEMIKKEFQSRNWGRDKGNSSRNRKFKVGDLVQVNPVGVLGTISSIVGDNPRVLEVLVGNARIRVDLSKVKRVERIGQSGSNEKWQSSTLYQIGPSMGSEIDLRGYYLVDALEKLDNLIANALAHNLQSVRVIHGKGTRALSNGIWKHLASLHDIKNYGFADPHLGGEGVTVIDLI